MSSANEEFAELMPHRIKVTGQVKYNDYGRPLPGTGQIREYRCLIDDTTTTAKTAAGEEITVNLTAYVSPVPVGSTTGLPVDIEYNETVEIVSPRPDTRPVTSIERHYDSEDGNGVLHNIVVRFS